MLHPLQEWTTSLRRKVRGLSLLHGIAWVVATALALFLVVGSLDYLVRLDDLSARILLWLLSLAGLSIACWWFVYRPLQARLTDIDVALRLERRFPVLRDRLATTLQFLAEKEDDPLAGSAAMRRAVVIQVADDVRPLRTSAILQMRPVLWATGAAGLLLAVVTAIAMIQPELTSVAAQRQFNPWGDAVWPQQTHLLVRGPAMIPRGGKLNLEIVDRQNRPLPDLVYLHLDFDGQPPQVVELRPGSEVLPFQLPEVQQGLTIWAEGGDDRSMRREPVRIEVVDTPTLSELQVTLHPPTYTRWPATAADRHFRALQGTRVELQGRANLPLSGVYFSMHGLELPGVVAADGLGFSFALPSATPGAEAMGGVLASSGLQATQPLVAASGSYSLRLVGREGFAGPPSETHDITSVTDQPPQVTLQEPQPEDAGGVHVATDAVVPLVAEVQEDRTAVREVRLRYTRSDQSELGPQELVIYQGPAQPPSRPQGLATPNLGERLPLTHRWSLASLRLPPKVQIEVTLVASDYRGGEGVSAPPLRLVVASAADLQNLLAQRQSELLSHLAELLSVQRQTRSQAAGVKLELENLQALRQSGFDQLKGTVSLQERVRQGLTDAERGLPAEIRRLLASLEMNGLAATDTRRRLKLLADRLQQLEPAHLDPLRRELPEASRLVQDAFESSPDDPVPVDDRVLALLDQSLGHQDAVIAGLERLQAEMTLWDNYGRFSREIGSLRREHDDIATQTAVIGRETITKDFRDLTPQLQTDLRQLGQRQSELARRLDIVQQNMERMSHELEESDPLAADVLSDALHHARSAGLSNRLRQASRQVEQNQVGQALGDQQAASAGLEEMLNILANRREHELSRLIERLREAETELNELTARQEALREQSKDAAREPDAGQRQRALQRLQREQQSLRQEADRLSRKVQRLQAEQAAESLSQAGQQMGRAEDASTQDLATEADRAAEQALQQLEQAQQQLAARRSQAERDLAEEQLAQLEDQLRGIRDRQQTVVEETERLAAIAAMRSLTRAEEQSARDAARQEELLQAEVDAIRRKVAAAEVFALALGYASAEMRQAARLLDQGSYTPEMTAAAASALRRLAQLVAALEAQPTPSGDEPPQQQGTPGDQPAGEQPSADGIPPLAQLKLLKTLQEDVQQRTADLSARWPEGKPLSEAARQQFEQLAAEQGQLAEMLLNLSQPSTSPAVPPEMPELKLDDLKLDDLKLDDLKLPLD